jgi:hypothetical protein
MIPAEIGSETERIMNELKEFLLAFFIFCTVNGFTKVVRFPLLQSVRPDLANEPVGKLSSVFFQMKFEFFKMVIADKQYGFLNTQHLSA